MPHAFSDCHWPRRCIGCPLQRVNQLPAATYSRKMAVGGAEGNCAHHWTTRTYSTNCSLFKPQMRV